MVILLKERRLKSRENKMRLEILDMSLRVRQTNHVQAASLWVSFTVILAAVKLKWSCWDGRVRRWHKQGPYLWEPGTPLSR
jgi:hypothetical protein